MNSDEEYTAIQRAEVLNELRAYLDKSHAPGAYKMMVDALEADANRLAALTRPHSNDEVEKVRIWLIEGWENTGEIAFSNAADVLTSLSHQLSEAREKARALSELCDAVDDVDHDHSNVENEPCMVCVAMLAARRALKSSDETKK